MLFTKTMTYTFFFVYTKTFDTDSNPLTVNLNNLLVSTKIVYFNNGPVFSFYQAENSRRVLVVSTIYPTLIDWVALRSNKSSA